MIAVTAFFLIPQSGSTSPSTCRELETAKNNAFRAYQDATTSAGAAAEAYRRASLAYDFLAAVHRLMTARYNARRIILNAWILLEDEDEIASARNDLVAAAEDLAQSASDLSAASINFAYVVSKLYSAAWRMDEAKKAYEKALKAYQECVSQEG